MRAFLGIDLDDDLRDELAALCDALRDAAPTWRGEKWVPRDNLHLTLRFLGEIDSESLPSLRQALAGGLATHTPFDTTVLAPVEAVPNMSRARMLWTRYHDPGGRCALLAKDVDDVLATFGILPEPRPFVPHVTLVRARRPRPFSCSEACIKMPVSSMSVREVTVFSSVLTRSGPVYERCGRIELGAR
jgi:RNA 2',3'-cyclic 3'-phosphodiesterase